jgi:hypothetical protein
MWICHALGYTHATAPAIVPKACFKRRASHVPNALETIDNEAVSADYLLFLMRSAHEKRDVRNMSKLHYVYIYCK